MNKYYNQSTTSKGKNTKVVCGNLVYPPSLPNQFENKKNWEIFAEMEDETLEVEKKEQRPN